MRAGLLDRVRAATEHEAVEQERLQSTPDRAEGVRAAAEGRETSFGAQ
jgi:enoyl-CoA hydratase/carnithine racemase